MTRSSVPSGVAQSAVAQARSSSLLRAAPPRVRSSVAIAPRPCGRAFTSRRTSVVAPAQEPTGGVARARGAVADGEQPVERSLRASFLRVVETLALFLHE